MDESVTVRDVMNRSYVGVSESDPVSGAAELMRREGVNGAVVLRGQEPVGVLNAGDFVFLVAADVDSTDVAVGDVMSASVLTIDADARLPEAIELLANAGARRAVVEEAGVVVGTLSDHDVVTAHASLPGDGADEPGLVAEPAEVEEDPGEALESEEFATQGVCEICGAFARPLETHNGQLVCTDCIET